MATSPVVFSGTSLDDPGDPILERVIANRFTLILGLLAAIVFGVVGLLLTGMVGATHGPNPLAGWLVLAFSTLILLSTLRQLLWPVPLTEVTSGGVRLRIRAPTHRSGLLFVPWSHVRAVVVTQTAAKGGGRENALGFQIIQDEVVRLPSMRWNSAHAAPEAAQCDVVFAGSMVDGDIVEWVQKIEEQRLRACQRVTPE